MRLALERVVLDGAAQPRAAFDLTVIAEYAEEMRNGTAFPPVTVFFDGASYWLADGFHRVHAAREAGLEAVEADVRDGTRRDAVLFSVGVNAAHGLRRTNADKRRAVETLLRDPEWVRWNDSEIARRCDVSDHLVASRRIGLGLPIFENSKIVERNGTVYEMSVADIGPTPTLLAGFPPRLLPHDELAPSEIGGDRVEVTESEDYILVSQWRAMSADERVSALRRDLRTGFNWQESDNIEWARWSWNPVTGCLHDCAYCYARDIAMRFYPQKFQPAFLPGRLSAPRHTRVPAGMATNIALKNVFTCSMADLFGRWVPSEWIEAVLSSVRDNPQWNFLFLTKFPIRLAEFEFPENAWVGTTVDAQARIPNVERAFAKVRASVKWLSCEPMLERLTFDHLALFDWVVVGGASRSTETPEFRPPREWVEHLEHQARKAGCHVYEKTNLLERIREYPGLREDERVDVPAAFKMGYLQRDVLAPKEYATAIGGNV